MSNFAFGTYRISDYNPQHIQSLKEAITLGISMIDTSSNYMDGGAERAIALAFREFDENTKSKVEIVSKFGYIQGENLKRHKEQAFEEVVEFAPDCYHSISKSFLQDQLTQSLKRLEMKQISCYLIHNPEYYLLDAINKGVDEDERLDEMYLRLYRAFFALEEEVRKGRILSYGISSNNFSKAQNSNEFLPYEDLITIADRASEDVGNDTHSFSTIQLPINILEQEGLKCASWAKENGLRVLVNRPLNAQLDNLMYRLADYNEPQEYYHHLNELLEVCDNDMLQPIYNLFEELDVSKHKFGWIGDYDSFFFAEILPHVRTALEVVDEKNKETMLNFIDLFFIEYRKMVAFECSKNTRLKFKDLFEKSDLSMQDFALNFLKQRESIDYILVGMRKPRYMHEVLALS
ncbi:aldo/keto reductase [Sulfurimonas sp.]|uniref:aldo/keto reductase n=1 Tax=Sulfurimonas sp. TaxID=2022749 RepID=UPI002B49625E|nr:aldo/keto reductase [Sulfurimonas sp.]